MNLKLILMVLIALAAVTPGLAIASPVLIDTLEPSWTSGVYSAYYGPSNGYAGASPGKTALYDGREAGIIKAGIEIDGGHYSDEGLFAFKPTVTINSLSSMPLTYDVETQEGSNPVWMTIEIDTGVIDDRNDNTVFQFVPTSNPAGWNTFDAGAGQWQKWNNADGDVTGNPLVSLSDIAADSAYDGRNVVRAYLRLGMGDSYHGTGAGTIAWVDSATIGGVTYDFVAPVLELTATPTSITILESPLMGATGGVATSNAAVDAATATRTPIQVRLTNTGGADSANVRIRPVGDATGHIQFWAKDSLGNWYDINIVGWGPGTGFPAAAGYDATTDVYAISDLAGTYALDVELETVADHAVVASLSGDVVVEADTTPPVTTATATGDAFSTWTFSDVQVTLSCADAESGCATTYVCIDAVDACAPTDAYTAPFTLTDQSYVRYYSVDNEGNAETVQSRLVKIDKTGPVYGDVTLSPSYLDGATLYISELSDISAPVSDAESDILSCYYTIDGTTSVVYGGIYDSGICTFTDVNTLGASSIAIGATNGAGAATWSTFKTVTVDSIAPVIGVTSPVADSYINSNSVVFSGTLSDMVIQWLQGDLYYASGAGITAIGFGTDPTFSYTRDFTAMPDDRYKIIYTAGDRVGHQTIVEVNFAVDRTAPTVTVPATTVVDATSAAGAIVTFSVSASDALAGSLTPACDHASGEMFPLGDTMVTCSATDLAGNVGTASFLITVSDTTAPETTVALTKTSATYVMNGSYAVGTWTHEYIYAVLSCTDDASGCDEMYYCTDAADTCTPIHSTGPSGTIGIGTEGEFYLRYASQDLEGNMETAKSVLIKTDRTAPDISGATTTAPNGEGWYNGDVVVHFTATDSLSGISSVTPDETLSTEASAQSSTGTAMDNVGNSASATVSGINIDKTAPTTSDDAPAGWQKADVTVTLTPADALSGVATMKYCVETVVGEVPCAPNLDYTAPVVISTEGRTYFRYTSADRAGNAQAVVTKEVLIDKTKPVITLNGAATMQIYVGETYTEQGANTTDNIDESVPVTISGTVNTSVTGTYVMNYTATDDAGNAADMVTRTVNVVRRPTSGGRGGGGGTCATGFKLVDGRCVKETTQPLPAPAQPVAAPPSVPVPGGNSAGQGNDVNQQVASTAGSGAAAPAQGDLLTGQVTGEGTGIQSWIWFAAIAGFILIGAVTYFVMRKH